ncbi:MAG: peptidylprolyl isomerase [Clostridiales bacterium]|nr:peptidylprolyl isomerase [Clostridiales bacterium]
MKRFFALVLVLSLLTLSFSACGKRNNNPSEDKALGDKVNVVIDIKDYGEIKLTLEPEHAPITVANFVELVNEGFYDGLTFHRIINGFMMQGGDFQGTGKSAKSIKGEFVSNGVDNPLEHTRGAISMARTSQPDSASSQFFIVHKDSPHLNGDYAAFGYVTEGLEIVDKICSETPVVDGNGTVERADQPIIKSIKLID